MNYQDTVAAFNEIMKNERGDTLKKEFETTMNVVCAWCGADMGTKDGKGQTGTTHGICKQCAEIELKGSEIK